MTLISTWSHLGHSNSRCSNPMGPDDTRSSIIRAWQREQRGRSMALNDSWDEGTVLPCLGREHYRLSVTDGYRWRGGDRNMPQCIVYLLVTIAHLRKFGMGIRSEIDAMQEAAKREAA
jgi:hypothetical protein